MRRPVISLSVAAALASLSGRQTVAAGTTVAPRFRDTAQPTDDTPYDVFAQDEVDQRSAARAAQEGK